MNKTATLIAVGLVAGVLVGCGSTGPPLEVVPFVDLDRYLGKWYEVARYPNSFEEGCVGSTAEYSIRDDGRINVLNTCYEGDLDGPAEVIEGTARVIDTETNAKLAVSFFFPFEGDYWIIDLDEDYQYAVVGAPNREFLWILSRSPQLDDTIYQQILGELPDRGYDPDRLEVTPQPVAD